MPNIIRFSRGQARYGLSSAGAILLMRINVIVIPAGSMSGIYVAPVFMRSGYQPVNFTAPTKATIIVMIPTRRGRAGM